MSRDLKYEKTNIELRRARVLELLTKGHSQTEIARKLNVSNALISLDIQYIREKSKKELETHISDRLPFEYARSMEGLNNVLKRVSEIEDSAVDNKTKMECMKLKMELYASIMSLATDGGVIEGAMKMIKIIAPLPGEEIPTEADLASNEEEDKKDIIEESGDDIPSGQEPETEED